MTGRTTNASLLVAVTVAAVSGWVAFGIGTGWVRIPVVLHSLAGLAVVVLTPWKSVVVRRGLSRRRPGRVSSILLSVLVAVAVASGVLFSTGIVRSYGPLNAMQVHVGSAMSSLPFLVAHARRHPVRLGRQDLTRRTLLRAGATLSLAGLAHVTLATGTRAGRLPGRQRRFTGSYERSSFEPGGMPVTQWFDDPVPQVEVETWVLPISHAGEVREYTYAQLSEETDLLTAVLDCTSGWYSTQEWEGVRLDRLLGSDRVKDGVSFVVRSATGYRRRFPLEAAPSMLLAVRVGGRPLSAGHGFPARIVAPGRRGFWWVKWITEISVDRRPWWWQFPFPLS